MKTTVKGTDVELTKAGVSAIRGNKSADLTRKGIQAMLEVKDVTTTVDLNKDELVVTIRVPKPLQKVAKAGAKLAAKRVISSKAKALKTVARRIKR